MRLELEAELRRLRQRNRQLGQGQLAGERAELAREQAQPTRAQLRDHGGCRRTGPRREHVFAVDLFHAVQRFELGGHLQRQAGEVDVLVDLGRLHQPPHRHHAQPHADSAAFALALQHLAAHRAALATQQQRADGGGLDSRQQHFVRVVDAGLGPGVDCGGRPHQLAVVDQQYAGRGARHAHQHRGRTHAAGLGDDLAAAQRHLRRDKAVGRDRHLRGPRGPPSDDGAQYFAALNVEGAGHHGLRLALVGEQQRGRLDLDPRHRSRGFGRRGRLGATAGRQDQCSERCNSGQPATPEV